MEEQGKTRGTNPLFFVYLFMFKFFLGGGGLESISSSGRGFLGPDLGRPGDWVRLRHLWGAERPGEEAWSASSAAGFSFSEATGQKRIFWAGRGGCAWFPGSP